MTEQNGRTDYLPHPSLRGIPEAEKVPAESEVQQLWTAEQVAERWQASTDLVYRLTRSGDLQPVRLGSRNYRYRLAEIERFEQEGGTAAVA
jgi:predicted DNA-binding transcriptional regulator AlpA